MCGLLKQLDISFLVWHAFVYVSLIIIYFLFVYDKCTCMHVLQVPHLDMVAQPDALHRKGLAGCGTEVHV